MSKELIWDAAGDKKYELGVDKVALYPQAANGEYPKGVAWNGVTTINENPSGAEPTPFYADNIKYANIRSAETYGATLEAYQSPAEFDACDGSEEIAPGVTIGQQARKPFGLAYRTKIGNDTEADEHGYIIHLVYGATASPSARNHQTVNESPELATLSWEMATTPVNVTGKKPTSTLEINSLTTDPAKLTAIEKILYGSTDSDARLPLPDEIASLMKTA